MTSASLQRLPLVTTPRLLALPGLGLGEEAWAPTLVGLGGPATVMRLPGYGVPRDDHEDLAPRALAELVVDVALADDAPTVVLAHSGSCQVAAHVAAIAADRVPALVLVGPTTDPLAATWPRMVGDWLRTVRREEPGQVPGLVRLYRRTGPLAMHRALNAARHDRIDTVVAGLRCPVLVLRGRHDVICKQGWAEALADAAPDGSAVATLEAGAHMVPLTHGDLVAEAVGDFLAGVP
ncbi:alpha/beta fold hydrolase [Nocardioides mesophilus]|uniref:Alpha/beta hydrolase n=1 Tax=Nocardioides mesophilus TaxID=433659 RepID=A0A7G9R9V7_9ACTN|nr:alpha/beta hydrolase [Nocardioides mesophilus]QNN52382.1 alpha/beta hydrolase [Nocardioides mesophilus]